ncbi:MAG TPA: T9SS type A sorting domain-containing protein [Bacteroidia bacterium]|jgi:hypothetical protein|nr:T9SS type A sorting domain-containing protein [Bacteroidia bacterium]
MKKFLLIALLSNFIFPLCIFAQQQINVFCFASDLPNSTLAFEDTGYYDRVLIDTVAYPGNIWQIGIPDKTILNSSNSTPFSIITDTVNPYPANNYSVFQLKIIDTAGTWWDIQVQLYYRMDSDSLHDGGMILTSQDNGLTWKNIQNDSTVSVSPFPALSPDTISALGQPGISGRVPGLSSAYWGNLEFGMMDENVNYQDADTVLIRFVFASDSITDSRDGWQIDDIYVYSMCEAVPGYDASSLIDIFPNPSAGDLTFVNKGKTPIERVSIHDMSGREVFSGQITSANIDLGFLPNGIYEAIFEGKENRIVKRITILH